MEALTEKTVAIHEAGHAVVALLLGVLIEATVISDGKFDGYVQHHPLVMGPQKATIREARRNLLLTLAGPAAQDLYADVGHRYGSLAINSHVDAEIGSDCHFIRQMAEIESGARLTELPDWVLEKQDTYECRNELQHYLEWLFARTKRFLSHPKMRLAITKIADALLASKTLSAEEVREICRPIFPCGPIKPPTTEREVAEYQMFACFRCGTRRPVHYKHMRKPQLCDCGLKMRNVTPQSRRISMAEAKTLIAQQEGERQHAVA